MADRVLGGRYQVLDKVGTGGMATVYRGMDRVLGRTVAIKTMLPQYATDPSFAARFKQEAQAAAALNSPYIVSVYDWGKDGDTYYIIMEYLRGTDLKSGIRKHGALDCKKVAQIGSQIAQALSVAHNHDIIHRDIKPQNIMVQPDGNIKVMDFGIARAKNSHLTTDNSVLGTAHYVSPEQTQGKPLGPTTDLYSLGIVMYEAATGRVPFDGDNAVTVAMKQVTEQPVPPSQYRTPTWTRSLRQSSSSVCRRTPRTASRRPTSSTTRCMTILPAACRRLTTPRLCCPPPPPPRCRVGTAPRRSLPRTQSTGRIRPQSATEQAAQEEEERQKKQKRNRVLAIVGAIAGIVVVALIIASVLGSGSKAYSVPNLLGLTQDEAQDQLDSDGHGFQIGNVSEQYSPSVEEGKSSSSRPPEPAERQPRARASTLWSRRARSQRRRSRCQTSPTARLQRRKTCSTSTGSRGRPVTPSTTPTSKLATLPSRSLLLGPPPRPAIPSPITSRRALSRSPFPTWWASPSPAQQARSRVRALR